MSIPVIWASPNPDGLTAACKDAAVSGILEAGREADPIQLNSLEIQRCRVCGSGYGDCKEKGSCVIADDLAAVYEKMIAAEAVVFITPVYWHDLSEPLKALMDRIRRMETVHNHALKEKPCIFVAAAGGSGRGTSYCMLNMEEICSHIGMVARDRLPITRFSRGYMLEAIRASAKHLCEEL
ncbi:MAG: flavodoxin family protein [Oscillospiraceae bacterium]|jgi:multimeric flavodoxin WrbA